MIRRMRIDERETGHFRFVSLQNKKKIEKKNTNSFENKKPPFSLSLSQTI